ncbi:MAG: aldo/keto reductase [Solirubrobacterales bacterium]
MAQRRLGSSGLEVGAVGLGCMGMSWAYGAAERDDERSVGVIRRAIELGVTLIDTAAMPGPFGNKELAGRALGGRREGVVLATKGGLVVDDPATAALHRDGRPEHIRDAIDGSLQRLRTDHIDLYQLHRPDPEVPLEETWGAMAEAVEAGKVRALGASELTVSELDLAHAVHPVASLQSELSLWTREPLADVLLWCEANDAAFIPFSPLGRGFLTGKISAQSFDADDLRGSFPRFSADAMAANQVIVDRVREIAEANEATAGQVALAWVLAQGDAVIPIPGTRRISYLEENAAASQLELSAAELEALDALPDPTGGRYPASYSP